MWGRGGLEGFSGGMACMHGDSADVLGDCWGFAAGWGLFSSEGVCLVMVRGF
jgi:hypothetical protein